MITDAIADMTTSATICVVNSTWQGAAEQRLRAVRGSRKGGGEKPWRKELAAKFANALSLPDNWDGPGSKKPRVEIAYLLEKLLIDALSPVSSPLLPFIVPIMDGGLQIEWHRRGAELEIAFFGSGEISGLFEDRITGGEIEVEGFDAIDLLMRYAHRVAQKDDHVVDVVAPSAAPTFSFAA